MLRTQLYNTFKRHQKIVPYLATTRDLSTSGSFTDKEKAAEDYYCRKKEKKIIENLREKLSGIPVAPSKDYTHLMAGLDDATYERVSKLNHKK